ncbi:MAG: hypothetical protein HZA66_18855 [Rhodopseudomonas palustris]|uniref:Uncharacterized protein n=1 Tax=Rhodopseudomonas palustris TaxID=1076 RepID=A0A933S0E2_RHOPL|nr:hypothetical protein [Rhodopseudomonas palustris]
MSTIVADLPLPPRPREQRDAFPLPTPADVVRLIMLDDWSPRTEREATLPAAFIAGAACLRIHYHQAAAIRIGEHWKPGKPNEILLPGRPPRPMPVLPIAAFAFERLRAAYGKGDGDFLFGSNDVCPLFRQQNIYIRMCLLGNRLDVYTGTILPQIHAFYDHAIPPETPRETKYALTGPRPGSTRITPEPFEVPVRKLRAFLRDHHPLSRKAGAYTGARGKAMVAANRQKLPKTPERGRRKETAAFREDPIVIEMRAIEWPEDKAKWRAFRLDLRDKHFAYLDGLRAARELARRELAFLFKAPTSTTDGWYRDARYRIPPEEAVERPEAEWKRIFNDAFAARVPGEKAHAVWWRTASAEKSPILYPIAKRWWKAAGLLKRPRGRPRKRSKTEDGLLSPRIVRERLQIGALVPRMLIDAGHLRKAPIVNPGHGTLSDVAVTAADLKRFDAKYVSLSALARAWKRPLSFRAVAKKIEAAGARPAFDPETAGTRFYRRTDLERLGFTTTPRA